MNCSELLHASNKKKTKVLPEQQRDSTNAGHSEWVALEPLSACTKFCGTHFCSVAWKNYTSQSVQWKIQMCLTFILLNITSTAEALLSNVWTLSYVQVEVKANGVHEHRQLAVMQHTVGWTKWAHSLFCTWICFSVMCWVTIGLHWVSAGWTVLSLSGGTD